MNITILAGGEASRLPSKPLLPVRWYGDHIPAVLRLIEQSQMLQPDRLVVIVPPNSPIPYVVSNHLDDSQIEYIVQEEPTGVVDAINLAGDAPGVVLPCDNIIELQDIDQILGYEGPAITVRDVPRWQQEHLDCWDSSRTRFIRGGLGPALTYPFYVPAKIETSLLEWAENASRSSRPSTRWWDIGTPETYYDYWRRTTQPNSRTTGKRANTGKS